MSTPPPIPSSTPPRRRAAGVTELVGAVIFTGGVGAELALAWLHGITPGLAATGATGIVVGLALGLNRERG